MRKYVTIIITPLLTIASEQANNIYSCTNPDAPIYAEHLDYVRERDDVVDTIASLDQFTIENMQNRSALLYISPSTILHNIWGPVLKKLIDRTLVHLLCIDE